MEEKRGKIRNVLEVIQWVLIALTLGICVLVCTNVGKYIEKQTDEQLYNRIYTDQKMERLNQENIALLDSLKKASSDTVFCEKTVYRWKCDTIYLQESEE